MLQDRQIFVAVAEAGGFTAAAGQLDLTVTTVSRRVKALENELGVRLFNRTTRRLGLTEAGAHYLAQVKPLLANLAAAEAELAESATSPRGVLRVSAALSFSVRLLGPCLARFAQAHPDLEVRFEACDDLVDLVDEGWDVALRIGYPADSSLVARPLLPIPRHVVAAPVYLERHGTPRDPDDLQAHACLRYALVPASEEWQFARHDGPVRLGNCRFASNNGDVLCTAAEAGLGLAHLPAFIVADALATGRLQRVLEAFEPPPYTLYALYPSRHFVPAKVRLFVDYLQGALSRESIAPQTRGAARIS